MKILDTYAIVRQFMDLVRNASDKEHCLFAVAVLTMPDSNTELQIVDSVQIQAVGGEEFDFGVRIPPKTCLALLSVCKKKNLCPVIIHSHPEASVCDESVSFSDEDRRFYARFVQTAQTLCMNNPIVFLLTDGKTTTMMTTLQDAWLEL